MLKLTRFLKEYKFRLIVGPAAKLTEAIFELIVPLVMAKIIDVGIKNGDVPYILTMGALMVGLGLLGLGCALICQYNAAKASQGFGTTLRNALFSHINTLSAAELDKIGAPSLITRMTNDTNQLQQAVAMLIRLVIRAPFLVIGSAAVALMIDFKLGLIFVAVVPIVGIILYLVMSRCVPLYRRVQEKLDRISLITGENLSGVRVIRAFNKQKSEVKRFEATAEDYKKAAVRVGQISALLSPITYIVLNIAIIAIIWFGGIRVNIGGLEQGQIVALVQYMTQILLALVVTANLVTLFTKASASARRVNEVFEMSPSVTDDGNTEVSADLSAPSVELRGVSFGYGAEPVIENLSLTVNRGETLGIIGGTGSGKSTVARLIMRMYDVNRGEVLINGASVKSYPLPQLKAAVGFVPQKAQLFSGSIRKNLQMGDMNVSDAQLWRALSIAQASEFVEKLDGELDFELLQGGKNLSGGQKQRLTIARALAARPDILILDDSASALDLATDAALRRALASETADTTTIIISQRVSAIRNTDKILVLDDGAAVGIGTHAELLDKCGVYSEICRSQLSEEGQA